MIMKFGLAFLKFLGDIGYTMTMEQRIATATMFVAEAETHLRACAEGMCPTSTAITLANSAMQDAVRVLSVV